MNEPSTTTGSVATGTDLNLAFPGVLKGLTATAAGATTLVIAYDNATAASGTVLARLSCLANTSATIDFGAGIVFNKGLTITVTGTSGTAVGYYIPGQ